MKPLDVEAGAQLAPGIRPEPLDLEAADHVRRGLAGTARRVGAAARSAPVATGCCANVDESMLCQPVHFGLLFHSLV